MGGRAYTWDGFGRLATATDGCGNTITYTYDKADRITKVDYSDAATSDVTYSYDAQGHVLTRVDGSGTTTYGYDDLGHLSSVGNTAGGATISYSYDLAGALASETDAHGTTIYHYDDAHQLSYLIYPQGGGTAMMLFGYDNAGRRTDTWLQTNATHSTWGGHSHTTYDGSGRVTSVVAQQGPASTPTTVLDQEYCYQAGSTPSGGCTASGSDRSNIQWMKNDYTGESSSYSYDDHNRLTKDVIAGGTNPRTYSFGYDAAGNRLTAVVTGTSPANQALTYNSGNQISSTGYGYDGAGNRTTGAGITAAYNSAGQLTASTKAGVSTSYRYAGTGNNELLTEAITGGDSYSYTYGRTDQNGLPEIEQVAYTHNASTVNAYVTHDNTGLPVLLTTSTGSACMYVYDGTGNPAAWSPTPARWPTCSPSTPTAAPPSPRTPAAPATPKAPTPTAPACAATPPNSSNSAPAGMTPPPATGPNKTPSTHPWTPPTATATPTPPTTPSTTPTLQEQTSPGRGWAPP